MPSSQLIEQLQSCLDHHDINALGAVLEKAETTLKAAEKEQIGSLLLQWAHHHLAVFNDLEPLAELILQWAPLFKESAEIALSSFCYHLGLLLKKVNYLHRALEYINQAYNRLQDNFADYHLWGNILIVLGKYSKEEALIEKGLDQLTKSFAKEGESALLLWDWAIGWQTLYEFSKERSDLKQALDFFKRAESKGIHAPKFFIDYGICLEQLASSTGDPQLVGKAIGFYRKIIHEEQAHLAIWERLALAHCQIALLTHTKSDFDKADRVFEEAIAACPSLAHLWLHWAKMLLEIGWSKARVSILESAIEKLTALKISELDPIPVNALLSQALMALGVLLDDGKLIAEGKERLNKVVELYPAESLLVFEQGFASLVRGIYFSDAKNCATAVEIFSKLVVVKPDYIEAWHNLYEAYRSWSEITSDLHLMHKAYLIAKRLVELRPYSLFYQTQLAEMLLRWIASRAVIKNVGRLVEDVIAKLKSMLSLYDDFEVAFQLACAWDVLGEITGEEACYQEAIHIVEILYAKLPTDSRVIGFLATALMHLGEKSLDAEIMFRAVHNFEKALARDFESNLLLERLGYCKLLLSKIISDPNHPGEALALLSEAETLLQKAAKLGCHIAYYHLACLYSQTKHFELAIECLKRADIYGKLPSIEALEHETWLENLRETEEFNTFLSGLKGS